MKTILNELKEKLNSKISEYNSFIDEGRIIQKSIINGDRGLLGKYRDIDNSINMLKGEIKAYREILDILNTSDIKETKFIPKSNCNSCQNMIKSEFINCNTYHCRANDYNEIPCDFRNKSNNGCKKFIKKKINLFK